LFLEQAKEVDIIITTALIPGKPAPKLILANMVEAMRPGSVVVDLAAETGGNCELTECGKVVVKHGVHIVGYADLPSRLAQTASQLYGNNLNHFLSDLGGAEGFHIDLEDDVVRGALVLHEGEITWPPPAPKHPPEPKKVEVKPAQPTAARPSEAELQRKKAVRSAVVLGLLAASLAALGGSAPPEFLSHLTVFVLACFVGWQVIWNVKPALHTPLMSVTNAISGIIIVGGMLQISGPTDSLVTILGATAVLLATINIAGGFLVTQRMLKMFQK
jgi:NAD(P) transhydrogenase subunit alpha